ncbi:glycosyltransferase family 39 protein [Bacteroidales bacterium OttesenSCG-928-C03]|nr:glycosyltransferase family 39 protein [Bacteroidales bacterium OttesenSCG-928-C03]
MKNNRLNPNQKVNLHLLLLLIITAIGAFLRFYNIGKIPLTDDEISALSRTFFDHFSDLIELGVKRDGHPAGVQVFLWLWSKCFGYSEVILRLPFLLMGIACVPLIYIIAKIWYNKNAGLFAAAIVATSQYTILYSVLCRPYIGLFPILLLLVFWSKTVFRKDFRWRNIIAFGVAASACAYTHQFAMLTAFLIAIAGLFFIDKKNSVRYLAGCALAILLYLPHLPILLNQISLKGVGNWLAPPTPSFLTDYLAYPVHFSWISAIGVLVAIICCSHFNKNRLLKNRNKLIISFILFILPVLIGYGYSIWVDPILQYSVLIFSFPFLLLFIVSFIKEEFDIRSCILIFIMMGSMIYGLTAERKHYLVMQSQWREISFKKVLDYRQQYGEHDVTASIKMYPEFIRFYEKKYNANLDNLLPKRDACSGYCLEDKIKNSNSNYLVAAGMDDAELIIIRKYYPHLIEYTPCFTSEVYVFSKNNKGNTATGMPLIYIEDFDFKEDEKHNEFIPIKQFPLGEITTSRYTKFVYEFDFLPDSLTSNYYLVAELFLDNKSVDWRAVNIKDFCLRQDEYCSVFMPVRYECVIKKSRKIPRYTVNLFLWNPEGVTSITPLHAKISAYKDNELIYGLVEKIDNQKIIDKTTNGCVHFTFDDQSIDEWIENRQLFSKYDIKTTFFICRPHLLSDKQIEGLKLLESDGHEIGFHGTNHRSIEDFIDSLDKWLDQEIITGLQFMKELGFNCRSFAYPFGHATDISDSLLSIYFSHIRKATYNYKDTLLSAYDEIFISDNFQKTYNSMGIDCNYGITLASLESGIMRAKKNGETLVLYAHTINNSGNDYSISPEYLQKVFELCKKHKVKTNCHQFSYFCN